MNVDFFEALSSLEKDRGIPFDFMVEKINKAIVKACKNNYNGNEDVVINIDKDLGIFDVYLKKTVVENVQDSGKEVSLLDARLVDPNTAIDEKVPIKLDTKEFGRIAAQTARNIIRQGIKDGERSLMTVEFRKHLKKIVTAVVERMDEKTGAANVKIGKLDAVLPKTEHVGLKKLKEGDHVKVYVLDVRESEKGPKVLLTRSNNEFIRKLFNQEIPEIKDGIVQIKSLAREPGMRTKIAVFSNDEKIDAIGSCIGPKGVRISNILKELGEEKIDVIEYNSDTAKYVESALLPALVEDVKVANVAKKICRVIVKDDQLSVAIGNKGQNVRLAAKLTGWKIDIRHAWIRSYDEELESDLEQKTESSIEPELNQDSTLDTVLEETD